MQRQTSSKAAKNIAMSNAAAAGINVVGESFARMGLHARFNSLYNQKEKVTPMGTEEPAVWMELLNEIGYHKVAEFVAEGYLPAEFAKINSIPLIYFFNWWNNCPKDLLRVAHQGNAQTNALKAELILSLQPPDKESADVMKEAAKLHMTRAEVFDPALWQQAKVSPQSNTPVVINIGGIIDGVSKMKTINHVDKAIPFSQVPKSVVPSFTHISPDGNYED